MEQDKKDISTIISKATFPVFVSLSSKLLETIIKSIDNDRIDWSKYEKDKENLKQAFKDYDRIISDPLEKVNYYCNFLYHCGITIDWDIRLKKDPSKQSIDLTFIERVTN